MIKMKETPIKARKSISESINFYSQERPLISLDRSTLDKVKFYTNPY